MVVDREVKSRSFLKPPGQLPKRPGEPERRCPDRKAGRIGASLIRATYSDPAGPLHGLSAAKPIVFRFGTAHGGFRGACHRAGHFGPVPLAPRNDELFRRRPDSDLDRGKIGGEVVDVLVLERRRDERHHAVFAGAAAIVLERLDEIGFVLAGEVRPFVTRNVGKRTTRSDRQRRPESVGALPNVC